MTLREALRPALAHYSNQSDDNLPYVGTLVLNNVIMAVSIVRYLKYSKKVKTRCRKLLCVWSIAKTLV